MSMISEQVKELKETAEILFENGFMNLAPIVKHSADTIESLSAKLSAANMERSERYYNGGWIACKERLPEEKINPITKDFYEYQVTFQNEDIKDVRHYKFGNGHWWNFGQNVDEYVTAWRFPIEPYQGE